MATNFTNKYMQVFQNYNEFSEHSADYVRGEDHIAFLIEENEVIYWLYLEQVWRPLNVRTTTTGQLEDGRTKVAVRLEYVEGGQKYTSVPNIPDPERITSMSRFLEDYPDIEEVNVSGTINLTDLSYAFAGSKIKDFSLLDTSNVDNITGFINNVYDETLNIDFKTNKHVDNSNIKNILLNDLKITTNAKDVLEENFYNFDLYNVKCNNFEFIQDNANYTINISGCNIDTVKNENGIVRLQYSAQGGFNGYINNVFTNKVYINCDSIATESININCDTCVLYDYSYSTYNFDYKAFITANNLIIGNNQDDQMNVLFGNGLKYNDNINISIALKEGMHIPSFIFTTPIVDDAFYAKYAQYNTPISIFQYKTTFEEVADVNISSEVDSSLLYINWSNIDFDTSNMNVEIHNVCNADFESLNKNFNKLIIDNLTEESDNVMDYPNYSVDGFNYIAANEGYISGIFKLRDWGRTYNIYECSLLKNAIIYRATARYSRFMVKYNSDIFSEKRNIKLYDCDIEISSGNNNNFDIYSLIEDNVLNKSFIFNSNKIKDYLFLFKYYPNIEIHIDSDYNFILAWYNYFQYTTEDNPIYIDATTKMIADITNGAGTKYAALKQVDTIYIKCADNAYINGFSTDIDTGIQNFINIAKNFRGVLNIDLGTRETVEWNNEIEHIDINSVKPRFNSNTLTHYLSCDNETLINLVTKLVDNTSYASKTIYMYRSQHTIIGEENIAAAVAKNYEFAIIEN